jgi:hypothetical protein
MSRKAAYGVLLLRAPAGAAAKAKKKKKLDLKAAFVFDEPRWQISMLSNFAIFSDYDNFERNGRGAGLFGLFRITRALSACVETGYFYFERAGGAPEDYVEGESTQVVRIKGLVRYDLDIIELHPYVAAGGSLYFFVAGNLKDFDPFHYGVDVELGLDFTLAERILFGVAFDWGWILKYAPPPGNDYPTFVQIAVKMGGIL